MTAAISVVGALQLGLIAVAGALAWWLVSSQAAFSVMGGGACALAGTAAYAIGLALMRSRGAVGLLRTHVIAQAAKVTVAVTLLILGLNSRAGMTPGLFIGGFCLGALAYPFALLLLNRKNGS